MMTTIIPHNESYLFYFRNINIFQIYYNHIFSFANVPPPKYRIEFILLTKDQEINVRMNDQRLRKRWTTENPMLRTRPSNPLIE